MSVLLIATAAPAAAGPLAEAISRHGTQEVAALRAQLPGDLAVRCTLGAVYARRGDLPRAGLYLTDCADATLPDDIAADVHRAARETRSKLRDSQLTELAIISQPAGITAEVAVLPGDKLVTPAVVWVKAGSHTITAIVDGKSITKTVTTQAYSRATVWLDLPAPPAAPPLKDASVDFSDEGAQEVASGPPPDVKHPPIMSDKFRGIAPPASGPALEDPLATRAAPTPVAMWLGVRLGGGMFDDAATAAHVGPSIGAAARFELRGSLFLAARLDWTRRGGASAGASIDALGASAGVGTTVVDRTRIAVAVIGQLRADLRFADRRDTMAVRRAGASVAAGIEVAFPTSPFTAGIRFEQGLTELVAGARDRALLVELGVDWR